MAAQIRRKAHMEHCGKCGGRARQPRGPLTGCLWDVPPASACRVSRAPPLRRLPLLSARWTAAGACLTRGAPAASKRTPQRACEGVEELDSSHAHLRRFLVKATDDFSAVGTESRLSCSPDFVHSLRRHRIACRSMCEREAGCGPSGAGAAQLAPRPNNSWLPCPRLHPSLRSLFILSFSSPLFPLPLPPKPHFSVATPSFLSSLIEVLLSESLSHGVLTSLLSLLSPLPTVSPTLYFSILLPQKEKAEGSGWERERDTEEGEARKRGR